jgi:hypothetical protein
MRTFYIQKPDMLRNPIAIKYCHDQLEKRGNIKLLDSYYIDDWVHISKLIYELKQPGLSSDEMKKIRKQLVTTIAGYNRYYPNEPAVISLLDVPDDSHLTDLHRFKKDLRKQFVNSSDKYYIRYLNEEEIDFGQRLVNINLQTLSAEYKCLKCDQEMEDDRYNMIFFNHLHCPDPDINSVEHDLDLLQANGVFSDKNKVR